MKLLTKTIIVYLSITIFLFTIGGIIFYFSLKNIINENITEHLEQTKEQVLEYVKKHGTLPAQPSVGSEVLFFAPATAETELTSKDTVYYSRYEEEHLPYRQLVFSVKTNEGLYTATTGMPMVESDDLIESIANSLAIVAGILFTMLLLFNWALSKSMWKPFYRTLESLKGFDLSKKETIRLPSVNTSEFRMLNEEIQKMTEKIYRDYQNLKEFTENASHELQTPLAIIRSKLELMIQSENIPQEQMKMIRDIYESANRLSKLNQSLLLLAKIENRQFHEVQKIDLKNLIEKKLEQLEDMIAFKKLSVEKNLSSCPAIRMNLELADILISNILSNSIRHNITEGKIIIQLKDTSLTVSNSGNALEIPSGKLFERFQKSNASAESVGLGLSIIKQICDTHHYKVNYSYASHFHTISVIF